MAGRPNGPGSGTRTGRLMTDLRETGLFRNVVPMEAGTGWPIPQRRGDVVYVRFPLFGLRTGDRSTGRPAELFPPFATVTVEHATGRPVEFQDLRYIRPWEPDSPPRPVGTFPHEGVRGTVGDYRTDRERLLGCYDALVVALAERRAFFEAEEFGELLRRLMEPGLLPYYRTLDARFTERWFGAGRAAT